MELSLPQKVRVSFYVLRHGGGFPTTDDPVDLLVVELVGVAIVTFKWPSRPGVGLPRVLCFPPTAPKKCELWLDWKA